LLLGTFPDLVLVLLWTKQQTEEFQALRCVVAFPTPFLSTCFCRLEEVKDGASWSERLVDAASRSLRTQIIA
jgi:hypothetical protein